MVSTVILENMEFYAYHGCYDLEQKVGTRFSVDVTIDAEIGDAAQNDDIEGTINYLTVFQLTEKQMKQPSKIIENVALRIIEAIYDRYPSALKVTVKLSKLAPSLGGKTERASVVLSK